MPGEMEFVPLRPASASNPRSEPPVSHGSLGEKRCLVERSGLVFLVFGLTRGNTVLAPTHADGAVRQERIWKQ